MDDDKLAALLLTRLELAIVLLRVIAALLFGIGLVNAVLFVLLLRLFS